ncbi:PREDICTED: protein abrupt isoform X2 [Polistes dominula]|uniref:Protein abrupt isoform X2 n=1 Tax=Polistes dominula TaxID=743375 RepID=A0ABM1IA12_POLDO|nr:PREDICTED: protein abrupt isoform X2 [Polistes dominula]
MAASSSIGEQQYSLRWNDFHSSILSSFRHLKDVEDFVDVTLSAANNTRFTAHKVVLSACSPYFRDVLRENPCRHPTIILKDVTASDVASLLRFMYYGEVNIGQEQLAGFLQTAQSLQVRGLADVNSGIVTARMPPQPSSSGNNCSAPATPRNTWQDNGRDLNDDDCSPPPDKRARSYSPQRDNNTEPKTDLQESLLGQALEGGPTIHTTPSNNIQAQSIGEDSNSMSDNEDISNNESILNSVKTEPSELMNDSSMEHHRSNFPASLLNLQGLMPGPSGIHASNQDPNYVMRRAMEANRVRATDPRPCPKCGKIYRSAHTLRTHLEDKHTVCPGYRCVLCGTVAKSRNSLHSHMSRQHRGISTKDLPVIQMPSPFNPELASQLLERAGIRVSPADLRARASPTGPRRPEMRLEVPRPGPSSDAGSSLCGGDDPEDLTLPLSLRTSSTPSSSPAVAVKSFKTSPDNREPNTAPIHPTSSSGLQPRQSATGSVIIDTYLQLIAETSNFASLGLTPDSAALVAAAQHAKLTHLNSIENKLATRNSLDDYPLIDRDENNRVSATVNEDRQNTSSNDRHTSGGTGGASGSAGGMVEDAEFSTNEDDYSDNEESEVNSKTE